MPKVYANPYIPNTSSQTKTLELNDYSKGVNNYTSNDVVKDEFWEVAQDARIPTLGEYETRKGFDYHSDAAGETKDQDETSTTGADDQSFSMTARIAQPFTTASAGRLTKLELNIKNDESGTGVPIVELWTDDSDEPGSLIASSSIAPSLPGSSYDYLTARFASAPVLATSTTYWIVVYVQQYGTNDYKWSSTTNATTALTSSDSGVTWSSTSFAMNFKQYYSTDASVKGVYRATKDDGTAFTLLATGTTLYSVNDVTGALTAIKTGLSSSATHYRFETVNNIVYYVNGYDGYRKWDFTTESQVNSSNYVNIIAHKGLMFLNDATDRNKWVFSNFADYETFTSTDFIYVPAPKTGDPSTAVASINGSLLFWTRRNKYILFGSDNATFQLEQAPSKRGTYSQETIAADVSGNFAYFLSDDGLYRTNGTEDQLITKNVYQDIRDLPNKDEAVVGVSKGRLYLYYSLASEDFNSRCWVFNLNFDCVESHDTDTYVSRFFYDANDDRILVGSSLVGQAYFQELDSNDYSNLDGELDFLLGTHHMTFGTPAREKEIRYWKPRFAAQSGNYTIQALYGYDLRDSLTAEKSPNVQGGGYLWGDSDTIWGSFVWGTTAELQSDLSVPSQYRRIKFAYRHKATRQPNRFLGHTFVAQIRRLR